MIGASDILFVQANNRVDHLPGVRDELAARGLRTARQDEAHSRPRVPVGTRLVVVTDLVSDRCRHALREAARLGARTALLMDGLTDWRNTFINPRVPRGFLRPAPADLVLCSGLSDARVLRAMGNQAVPTGLPRIDHAARTLVNLGRRRHLVVATANTPAHVDEERPRIVAALDELRDSAERAGWAVSWRLTGGLGDELGVETDEGPLIESLRTAAAVVTTPSTLMVEAMRAGLPTALMRLHGEPLWHASAWVWEPDDSPDAIDDTSGVPGAPVGLSRWVDSADRLLRQLDRPTAEQRDRQAECLRWLDASSAGAGAAELVADAIAGLLDQPVGLGERVALPPDHHPPRRVPRTEGRRRVVSCVVFDDSPLGGVTTFSQRLARSLGDRPELGYDARTLLIAWDPAAAHKARPLLDDHTELCVVDRFRTADEIVAHLCESIERLEPDLVLPNYSDATHIAAGRLRERGVRCVGIGHTDDDSYRELLLHSEWDGAVAVSEAIHAWLQPLAGDRPCETIVYGVPIAAEPRSVRDSGPLRIAYVGRVQQAQKRVMDLVPVVEWLGRLGVDAELHVVGEGVDLPRLRRALPAGACVRFHGSRNAAWVARFLPTIDVSLLVSEAEGTSISMLEAMGAGVVPAVTRVSSGAGDWVEDGVSGVTAPVGDAEAMARRLAWLAEDRSRLIALGTEAHRRVAATQSLDRMAERYASLFDRVLEAPLRAEDAGATPELTDAWRWMMCAPSQGNGLDCRCRDELIPHVERMAAEGCGRIAIYGLGQHTQGRSGVFERGDLPIVGIIDDAPPPSGEAFGLPVVTLSAAADRLRTDGVLVSSDAFEEEMVRRAAPLAESGVLVRRIYGRSAQAAAAEREASPA